MAERTQWMSELSIKFGKCKLYEVATTESDEAFEVIHGRVFAPLEHDR